MNKLEKGLESSSGSKTGRNIALATALATLLSANVDAQTVGKNFDAKHLAKYEKTYEKNLKQDDNTKDIGKTYDMSAGDVVKMYHDEVDFMVKQVTPKLVVDHTTFKQYLVDGLQENNILAFLLTGAGSAEYRTLADGLSTELVDYETKDIISNKIKFPIDIPSKYVESLGDDYKDQTSVIKKTFDNSLKDAQGLLKTGKIKIWFAGKEAWELFKKENPSIIDYYVELKKDDAGKLKGGVVELDFNKVNTKKTGDTEEWIGKTDLQRKIIGQLFYWKILEAKYDQIKKMIDKKAKDATIENK